MISTAARAKSEQIAFGVAYSLFVRIRHPVLFAFAVVFAVFVFLVLMLFVVGDPFQPTAPGFD